MKLTPILSAFIILGLQLSCSGNADKKIKTEPQVQSGRADTMMTVDIKTTDDLTMKADLYLIKDSTAPFIMLFHQAGWSRGEYLEIAPELNKLGFNCIAVDQRSGEEINDVKNSTYADAVKKRKGTEYENAYPDLQTTLNYVKTTYHPTTILAWGSSYSSALVLVLGSENPGDIDGIVSFSPGEYFTINGKTVTEHSKTINCPVFITSAKNEESDWKGVFEVIPAKDKVSFLPKGEGKHGSRALWKKQEGNEEYWEAIKKFLEQFK